MSLTRYASTLLNERFEVIGAMRNAQNFEILF
jgi:hypothetical protein